MYCLDDALFVCTVRISSTSSISSSVMLIVILTDPDFKYNR